MNILEPAGILKAISTSSWRVAVLLPTVEGELVTLDPVNVV
jgi:hypothetical protein